MNLFWFVVSIVACLGLGNWFGYWLEVRKKSRTHEEAAKGGYNWATSGRAKAQAPAPASSAPDHQSRPEAAGSEARGVEKAKQLRLHRLWLCSCREGKRCLYSGWRVDWPGLEIRSTQTDSRPENPSSQTSSRKTVTPPGKAYVMEAGRRYQIGRAH